MAAAPQKTQLEALVRLRYWAIGLVCSLVLGLSLVLGATLPVFWLCLLLLTALGSNLLLPRLSRFEESTLVSSALLLDALLLTGFLALVGGPANPFSVLYLILVTLAATMTRPRFTWIVVTVSSAGYALTFFYSVPLPPSLGGHHAMHHAGYGAHLQGMWIAHAIAACAIAAFVTRLSERLRHEREERGRAARLLGLATLAAGAAHEIGNPLATIRVAASELERDLESGARPEHVADLRLINSEVERARKVLERMSIGAGELLGESPVAVEVAAFMARAVEPLGTDSQRIRLELGASLPSVRWPVHAVAQAFTQLFRNGLEASTSEDVVTCRARRADSGIVFEVVDEGAGMPKEVLERLGEPFFTTRSAGMGLGVFIARSLIEHLGGRFAVDSAPSRGTTVHIWLPVAVLS